MGDPEFTAAASRRGDGSQRCLATVSSTAESSSASSVCRAAGTIILDRPAGERPDGVFAASDLLALGLVQTLSASIRIPDDLAVIGYDNNSAVRESAIPISTIAQPGREMGELGARLLWSEVAEAGTHRHEHVVLAPELIARGSSVRADG